MQTKRLATFGVYVLIGLLWTPALWGSVYVSNGTSGSLGYSLRQTSNSLGTKDLQHLITTQVANRFYLLEDWIARGDMNFSFSKDITQTQSGGHQSDTVTGNAGIYLLPQSAFPFSISFARSDSRVERDVILNNVDYAVTDAVVTQTLRLQQSLIGKGYRAQVNYLTNQQSSNQRGDFGIESYGANLIWRQQGQDAALDFSHKDEVLYLGGARKGYNMTLRHGYYANPRVTLSTYASFNVNEHQMAEDATGLANQFNSEMTQANSNLSWRSADNKTSMNAGVRFYGVDLASNASERSGTTSESVTGNVSLMHRITKNLSSSLALMRGMTQSEAGNGSNSTDYASDKASLRYRSDRINLSDYLYSWQASFDIGQRADEALKELDLATSVSHDMFRDWRVGRLDRIFVRASQDFALQSSFRENQQALGKQRLGHRFGMGWNQYQTGGSKSLQLSFSDSRYLEEANVMQVLMLDYTQQKSLTNRMALQLTLSHQQTHYEYGETQTQNEAMSRSALMTFNYINVGSIPGLSFNSDLKLVESQVNDQNDVSNELLWRNNLVYRIGKLESNLQYLNRDARGVGYQSLYFNVKRIF